MFKPFPSDWHGWIESTQSSVTLDAITRDFPDSEPTENVINSEGVKESAHVLETLLPPFVVVVGHKFPVISWEAPVLTSSRECVWWSTSGGFHVEEGGTFPGI